MEHVDVDSLRDALGDHVRALAGTIGERNVFRPGTLSAAADYIRRTWRAMDLEVAEQVYETHGTSCANLEVVHRGHKRPEQSLVIGAHYDTVRGSPGADDNASGVAALLEISRVLNALEHDCTVRCVAFVNEESPFFYFKDMGSRVYATAARRRGEDIRLMISLEMLGCYLDRPGSQCYPLFLRHFYPDRGNFIGFVSNLRSRKMLKRTVRAFRAHSSFPCEQLATFAFVRGVALSDHLSFWRAGYRALMVTDTAFYRNPDYHTADDTPDRIDYASMARVTAGLVAAIADLANDEP